MSLLAQTRPVVATSALGDEKSYSLEHMAALGLDRRDLLVDGRDLEVNLRDPLIQALQYPIALHYGIGLRGVTAWFNFQGCLPRGVCCIEVWDSFLPVRCVARLLPAWLEAL